MLACIETVEAWARDLATIEQVHEARRVVDIDAAAAFTAAESCNAAAIRAIDVDIAAAQHHAAISSRCAAAASAAYAAVSAANAADFIHASALISAAAIRAPSTGKSAPSAAYIAKARGLLDASIADVADAATHAAEATVHMVRIGADNATAEDDIRQKTHHALSLMLCADTVRDHFPILP